MLTAAAAARLPQLGLSSVDAIGSLIVFVIVVSLSKFIPDERGSGH
jgi:hypothetical protein